MSELTLAEAAAAPLVKAAEAALAPEAQKALEELRAFVGSETDKLRAELPAAVNTGVEHLHALGAGILARYQAVMDHIDTTLKGATPGPTTAPEAPTTPTA